MIKINECPRDAFQGISKFIPTEQKISYYKNLLKVGYDTLDFGSFVSAKAIPQMSDTAEVLNEIKDHKGLTKLLAIIANIKGAEIAIANDGIDFLGYPLSINETFQERNTKRSIKSAFEDLKEIKKLVDSGSKELVIYLSMAFGNPYNEHYSAQVVADFAEKVEIELQPSRIALSDTIGAASPELVKEVFGAVNKKISKSDLVAHFHVVPGREVSILKEAIESGCEIFDASLNGIGGCPMAKNELTGNLNTLRLIDFLDDSLHSHNLDHKALDVALADLSQISTSYF